MGKNNNENLVSLNDQMKKLCEKDNYKELLMLISEQNIPTLLYINKRANICSNS
jgi:hypothetical protein